MVSDVTGHSRAINSITFSKIYLSSNFNKNMLLFQSDLQAFTLVRHDALCSNWTNMKTALNHGFGSKEKCARVMPSLKGKHGCSNASGIFIYNPTYDFCACAVNECQNQSYASNYNIYRMIGNYFLTLNS